MSKQYRPRRLRIYKVPKCCADCGEARPPTELFCYADSANESITQNSPALCRDCYNRRYPGWNTVLVDKENWNQ